MASVAAQASRPSQLTRSWSTRTKVGANLGQSRRPTADFGELPRTGTRTLVFDCISERTSANPCGRHFGRLCIVPPSALNRPILSSKSAVFGPTITQYITQLGLAVGSVTGRVPERRDGSYGPLLRTGRDRRIYAAKPAHDHCGAQRYDGSGFRCSSIGVRTYGAGLIATSGSRHASRRIASRSATVTGRGFRRIRRSMPIA